MDSKESSKIERAKFYAEERKKRIRINAFRAIVRGANDVVHQVSYDNGIWKCDCRFFNSRHVCSHTMALERILDNMIHKVLTKQESEIEKPNKIVSVFVLMPFNELFNDVYELGIKAACSNVGARCQRVDEQIFDNSILERICSQIEQSDLIIAEMTGRNPNVYYEAGYAHALKKRVIFIIQDAQDIPFDLQHYPHIIYGGSITKLKTHLEVKLRWFIDNPPSEISLANDKDINTNQFVENLLAEVTSLRKELLAQVNYLGSIVKSITAPPTEVVVTTEDKEVNLQFFEGVWLNEANQSLYCARIINGQLYIPYSFAQSKALTAHYHDCRLIGNVLFCRFRWFDSPMAGYVYLRVESKDIISGGWAFTEDLPESFREDISILDETSNLFSQHTLIRMTGKIAVPKWADRYFDRLPYYVNIDK